MDLAMRITRRFGERSHVLFGSCRARVLVVTDNQLNFKPDHEFGLWRFIEAVTDVPLLTRPKLTLAYRGVHEPEQIQVGADSYDVLQKFEFNDSNPAVTLRNFDQIWLFGNEFGPFELSPGEVSAIVRFMNGGGGVFATGDHTTIGEALCGELPRIRHMRDWSSVPMGFEAVPLALERIDTIVAPGVNTLYEFDDQSDEVPQRIYPNYRVIDIQGDWEAAIHPTLLLPGGKVKRTDPTGFQNDIDVFPDHAHESVCFDVDDPNVLSGQYAEHGQQFPEWQPDAKDPQQRVGASIIAYAVSGGRAILRGGTKPPVRPRMFGVLSAYDGRAAQPYQNGGQPPGRILCDSTWHHYVNINLDGTGTSNPVRTGLGTGSGANFVPNEALEKIYIFFRNAIKWLQPANRVWCPIITNLIAVRYSPQLIEELGEPEKFTGWSSLTALGAAAAALIADDEGGQAVGDWITGALRSEEKTRNAGNLLDSELIGDERDELLHGILGGLLVKIATLLPDDDQQLEKTLGKGIEHLVRELEPELPRLVSLGARSRIERVQQTLTTLDRLT